jgi:hypothetical protein
LRRLTPPAGGAQHVLLQIPTEARALIRAADLPLIRDSLERLRIMMRLPETATLDEILRRAFAAGRRAGRPVEVLGGRTASALSVQMREYLILGAAEVDVLRIR